MCIRDSAEDAKQDILIKVITSLSSYKGKSLFSTWVYKIAVNHLINEKNKDFANHPLSFEIFGSDIDRYVASSVDQTNLAEKKIFSEELKLSCTNVLLQCLNPFDRLIFILGTMFDVDSRLGSEITGLSADNFRQRLSRSRKVMSSFLSEYCEHAGGKKCNCMNRVNYALSQHRIDPALPYSSSLVPEESPHRSLPWKTLMPRQLCIQTYSDTLLNSKPKNIFSICLKQMIFHH